MNLKHKVLVVGFVFAFASTTALATVYTHDIKNPKGSAAAGDITNFTVQYNDSIKNLTGTFTLNRHKGKLANTSWMVLSGGKNPKGNEKDHAILFMDYKKGTTWAYQYNGKNDATSYANSNPIAIYKDSLMVAGGKGAKTRTVTFNLDVTAVQNYGGGSNPNWTGTSFGKTIGVWYHPAVGKFKTSKKTGGIRSYTVYTNGWYDIGNGTTTYSVPEISTSSALHSMLLLLGLGALVRDRRRKRLTIQS